MGNGCYSVSKLRVAESSLRGILVSVISMSGRGPMNPDADPGENARYEEVSDDQATSYVSPEVKTASRVFCRILRIEFPIDWISIR